MYRSNSFGVVGASTPDVAHYAFRADHVTATVVKIESHECGSRRSKYVCWRTALVSWSDHGQSRVTALRGFYGSPSPSPTVSYYEDLTGSTLMGRKISVNYRHGDNRPTPLHWLRWKCARFVIGSLGIAIASFARWRRLRPALQTAWKWSAN